MSLAMFDLDQSYTSVHIFTSLYIYFITSSKFNEEYTMQGYISKPR